MDGGGVSQSRRAQLFRAQRSARALLTLKGGIQAGVQGGGQRSGSSWKRRCGGHSGLGAWW